MRPGEERPDWTRVSVRLHSPVPGAMEAAKPTAGAAGEAGGARGLGEAAPRRWRVPGYFWSGRQWGSPGAVGAGRARWRRPCG